MARKVTIDDIPTTDLLFPSDYLDGADLTGDTTATIADIEPRRELTMSGNRTKVKPCLFMRELDKWFVLNQTNKKTIRAMYGPELKDWVGKRITLYFDPEVMFGTKKTGGTRVRPKVPPVPKQDKPKPADVNGFGTLMAMVVEHAGDKPKATALVKAAWAKAHAEGKLPEMVAGGSAKLTREDVDMLHVFVGAEMQGAGE